MPDLPNKVTKDDLDHLVAQSKIEGMFVYIVPAASYPAQRNAKGVLVGDYPDDMVPYSSYIALKSASGEVVPWTISQSDSLATD